MTGAAIPIARYLVPETAAPPSELTRVTQAISRGLPHTIDLDGDLKLVLTVPNGVAAVWRDSDPTAVVSRSSDQVAASPRPQAGQAEPLGAIAYAPARLYLERGQTTLACVPLVSGLRRTIPDTGRDDAGVRIELLVVAWDLRAGSLRGAGDFGSFVDLAWRRAGRAGDRFDVPPLSPRVAVRLERELRREAETPPDTTTRVVATDTEHDA
jgi:hypothetical protein